MENKPTRKKFWTEFLMLLDGSDLHGFGHFSAHPDQAVTAACLDGAGRDEQQSTYFCGAQTAEIGQHNGLPLRNAQGRHRCPDMTVLEIG
jgi:hypothetical protein